MNVRSRCCGTHERRVHDLVGDLIAEAIQFGEDDLEGPAAIVGAEVLDVLEKKDRLASSPRRSATISKKRLPLVSSAKPCSRPRLDFLETPAMLKGWHGKPGREHVVRGQRGRDQRRGRRRSSMGPKFAA